MDSPYFDDITMTLQDGSVRKLWPWQYATRATANSVAQQVASLTGMPITVIDMTYNAGLNHPCYGIQFPKGEVDNAGSLYRGFQNNKQWQVDDINRLKDQTPSWEPAYPVLGTFAPVASQPVV